MDVQDIEIKGKDLRIIRQEMDRIRKQNPDGLLLPNEMVESAREAASPLHRCFNWDDAAAAHQHRLSQARTLIREIEVTYPDDQGEVAVPKYVSLVSDRKRPGGGYRETGKVMGSVSLLAELEETAKRDLGGLLRRYEMLRDFCAKVRVAAGLNEDGTQPSGRRPRGR